MDDFNFFKGEEGQTGRFDCLHNAMAGKQED